jgi:acetylornithine deacetylase
MHNDNLPQQATIDCLSQLIHFDTTSRNSNLELIEWSAAYLQKCGAKLLYDFNAQRTKANLFATFGDGPGGVVLSGHTDVVPVDGQKWSSDPFVADIRDGNLYGRGACDMKAFIGVMLSQAPRIAAANLKTPIHLALTYDEEMGCLGIPGLLASMQEAGIQPTGCIVGEPTSMQTVIAHKGGRIYRCNVRGHAAHSSLTPTGVNAIEYAAKIISFIQDIAAREEARGQRIEGFDVPFSTISTNVIVGGNGKNIIPAECEFFFEYRFLPGVSPDSFIDEIRKYVTEELETRMKARNLSTGVSFDCIGKIPALDAGEHAAIVELVQSLLRPHRPAKVAYGTEAAFFQDVGVPSVVCGPGSINQAHKPDEFVALEQLRLCEVMIQKLVARLET